MYRPQFAYPPTPPPCQDQRCVYSFDATNTPALNRTLAAGAESGRIVLQLDTGADFLLRAIETFSQVSLRLEDSGSGNPLSDSENLILSTNYEIPTEYSATNGLGIVALESGAGGVLGHAGGNFSLFLYNHTASNWNLARFFVINLHGVKVFRGGCQ